MLIPRFGITGAALASLISKYIYNSLKYILLYKKYKFQPFSYRHILIVIFAFAAWYLSTFIPAFDSFIVDLIIRSTVIGTLFLVPVYFFKISEDINRKVRSVLGLVFRQH